MTGTPSANTGTRIATAAGDLRDPSTVSVASRNPRVKDPASPMNTRAGAQL